MICSNGRGSIPSPPLRSSSHNGTGVIRCCVGFRSLYGDQRGLREDPAAASRVPGAACCNSHEGRDKDGHTVLVGHDGSYCPVSAERGQLVQIAPGLVRLDRRTRPSSTSRCGTHAYCRALDGGDHHERTRSTSRWLAVFERARLGDTRTAIRRGVAGRVCTGGGAVRLPQLRDPTPTARTGLGRRRNATSTTTPSGECAPG
jgi:hypothetical protein